MKRRILVTLLAACMLLLAACGGAASTSDAPTSASGAQKSKPTYPTKPIEVVVPYAAGGGSSIISQTYVQIMNEEGICPVDMNIVNKPGGGTAIGLAYVAAKRGNPYYLLAYAPSVTSTPLQSYGGVDYRDLTPIAILGYDSFCLAVKEGSPFTTLDEMLKYAKENPGKLNVSGSGVGSSNHVFMNMVAEKAGVAYNYIPYDASSDVSTAVLGGHVDVGILKFSDAVNFVEAKQMVALAVGDPKRNDALPEVPTFTELGVDIVFAMPRGICAPGDIDEEVRQTIADMFKQLTSHERWQKEYVEKYGFTSDPMFLDDAKKYLDEQYETYKKYLSDLGLVDQASL